MIEYWKSHPSGGISRRGLIGGVGAIVAAGLLAEGVVNAAPATASTVWWFPLTKRPKRTSGYGTRVDPVTHEAGAFHDGNDFDCAVGTPVYAMRAGTVNFAGLSGATVDVGYGNYVRVQHDGGYETGYGHLQAINVAVGAAVQAGTLLGFSGNTGKSTGAHLHVLMHLNGSPYDPTAILDAAPLATGSTQPLDVPKDNEEDDMANVITVSVPDGGTGQVWWSVNLGDNTKARIYNGTQLAFRRNIGIAEYSNQPPQTLQGFKDISTT